MMKYWVPLGMATEKKNSLISGKKDAFRSSSPVETTPGANNFGVVPGAS
jgi:hypothetical protein